MAVETDKDPAVPGSFDELIDETEQLLNEEEDGTEEVPEDEGKRNAAFARMRQANKKRDEALRQMLGLIKQVASARDQSQPAARQRVPTSELDQQRRTYRKNVHARALQRIGRLVDMSDAEDVADLSFEMFQVITEDRLALEAQRSASRRSSSVISDVLSQFPQLGDDDKAALKKEIETLPVESRADEQAVKDRVHSYLGRHIERFSKAPAKADEKDTKGAESSSAVDEDYGLTTFDDEPLIVRGDEEDLVGRDKAGAAAASGLKSGSRGVETKSSKKSSGHKAAPNLSKEDREKMKLIDLDPNKPEDVETFRYADRRKGNYT